jgi:protein SCO1/2
MIEGVALRQPKLRRATPGVRGIRRRLRASATASMFFLTIASVAAAAPSDAVPPGLQDVGIDQNLDAQVPLDLTFRDESGAAVRLEQYFHDGKPVILNLVYYECPMLCTLVLNGLTSALRALSFDVGKQFEIITVSFDPKESAELAAGKKQTYLDEYRRPGADKGWHFLTGDAVAIESLARSVGFRYRYDPAAKQFAHAAAIMVLTPKGRVARYFYGVEYAPRDLRLGLIEAADNRIGNPVDQLLLYCFHYDPTTGKYSAAVLNIVRLAGAATVLGLLGFIVTSGRGTKRSRKAAGSSIASR